MLHLCSVAFILCLNTFSSKGEGNYPTAYLKPKPCARIKNTVTYQDSVCVPDCNGGFTPDSKTHCESDFKNECPEFNEASCEWFTLDFPGQGPREIPTCRLKYYAQYTWMEIHYTHQYGPWMTDKSWTKTGANCGALPIYDIVEVNRKIKKHHSFGNRDVENWPKSVSDSTGERGLKWTILKDPKPYPPELLNNAGQLCTQTDDLCKNTFTKYLNDSGYNVGFADIKNPKLEAVKNHHTDITRTARCIDVLLPNEKTKTRACQVLYAHKAKYEKNYDFVYTTFCNITYLEVNLYRDPQNPKALHMRYGHWFTEDDNATQQISCDRLHNV